LALRHPRLSGQCSLAVRALDSLQTISAGRERCRKNCPTKTDTSRRQAYLPKIAVEALGEHHGRAVAQKSPVGPDDRIFTAPEGGPLRRKNVLSRSFKPLLKRAGIPTTTRFHDLRNTYATELLTSSADAKVIQAQLGHSKIGVTLDTYARSMPSLAKGAVSKLDDAFGVPQQIGYK
jgi:integrase